jgi:hypothetical protein
MGEEMTPKPWSRRSWTSMSCSASREYVDAALVLYRSDDDEFEAMLREGGEGDVWRLVQKVIDGAG